MSYVKTTWSSSDVVTVENLNKIEQGIYNAASGSGDVIFLTVPRTTYQLNMTMGEIGEAFLAGKTIWIKEGLYMDDDDPSSFVCDTMYVIYSITSLNYLNDPNYQKDIYALGGTYSASDPNSYPSAQMG